MDKYTITLQTYNKYAKEYQDKYMDMDCYHDTYDLFCRLVEKKNAEIFEIACGPGNITRYLLNSRPDFKILATDLSENMIELAKVNNPTANFQLMDCRNIDEVNKKFDGIMCGFCLPYLSKEDAAKLIHDASGLLNPGGIFYLSTMEGDYEKSGFQTSSSGGEDRVYIHYHQADYLIDLLEENAFEILDIQRRDFLKKKGRSDVDLFLIAKL